MHFNNIPKEEAIRAIAIVFSAVESFAEGFKSRRIGELDNPNGKVQKGVRFTKITLPFLWLYRKIHPTFSFRFFIY